MPQRPVSERPHSLKLSRERGADQSAKDAANINTMMAQYQSGGAVPASNQAQATFGDFSATLDLHAAYEVVHRATEAFEGLDSHVRAAAMNSPVQFNHMLDDPHGREMLAVAGLDLLVDAEDSSNPPSEAEEPPAPAPEEIPDPGMPDPPSRRTPRGGD